METVPAVKPTETTTMTEADADRIEAKLRTPLAQRPLTLPPGYRAVPPLPPMTTERFVAEHGGPALPFTRHGSRRWCKDGGNYFNDGGGLRFELPPAHALDRLRVQFTWRKAHLQLAVHALRDIEELQLLAGPTSSVRFLGVTEYRWDQDHLGKPPLDGGRLDLPAAVERLRFLVDCRRRKVLALKAELAAHGVEVEERFIAQ
jgi:hypothetical protein